MLPAGEAQTAPRGSMDNQSIGSEPERARRTFWGGVLVFRCATFVWMFAANLIARDTLKRPALAWTCIGVTGVWTAYLTRNRSRSAPMLWTDLALSFGLLLASGFVVKSGSDRLFFATTYPASTALAWGAARGRRQGLGAGVVLSAGLALEREILGQSLAHLTTNQLIGLLNGMVYYLVAGGAAGVVRRTIDRSGEQMRAIAQQREQARAEAVREEARAREEEARAREEAAARAQFASTTRMLHETVMNELLSLHKDLRGLEQQPTLSGSSLRGLTERCAELEQELREWVRHPPTKADGVADLRSALGSVATAVGGIECEVDVLAVPLPATIVQAFREATREALRNVARHAGVAKAVIRAQVSDGVAEVSVRDDGRGFTFDRERLQEEGHLGLIESIKGRIEELGGTVDIQSEPGRGTGIKMRIPVPRPLGGASRGRRL